MTYLEFRLGVQRWIALGLTRVVEPRVGVPAPRPPFDPKTPLSDAACRALLASGAVSPGRRP